MTPRRSGAPWLVAAFLAGIVAAWMFTPSRAPAPWLPVPSPHEDRPILAGIVRLAKTVGWFLVFAQPAPSEPQQETRVVEAEEPGEVGGDGYAVLRNARGW
jgi:hypothetical protein